MRDRLKRAQYAPSTEVLKHGPRTWTMPSRSTDKVRHIQRRGDHWYCSCPARVQCWHVLSVIMYEADQRGWRASLWGDWADAQRQKRRMWQFVQNRLPFWVTSYKRAETGSA